MQISEKLYLLGHLAFPGRGQMEVSQINGWNPEGCVVRVHNAHCPGPAAPRSSAPEWTRSHPLASPPALGIKDPAGDVLGTQLGLEARSAPKTAASEIKVLRTQTRTVLLKRREAAGSERQQPDALGAGGAGSAQNIGGSTCLLPGSPCLSFLPN